MSKTDTNLSPDNKDESKKKKLVENPQVMGQAIEQQDLVAYYDAQLLTQEDSILYQDIPGLQFSLAVPEAVCDFLSAANVLLDFKYRSIADLFQQELLGSIESFIGHFFVTISPDLTKSMEKSLEEFSEVLQQMAKQKED